MGWQTYSVLDPEATQEMCGEEQKLVESLPRQLDSCGLPKSACLGVLGVPGLTAYIALLHACKAKERETLVISSAAGQIGHICGQIAKYMGLKVKIEKIKIFSTLRGSSTHGEEIASEVSTNTRRRIFLRRRRILNFKFSLF